MKTLYLLDYNNYYNRIVKKENSLSDYQNYLVKYKGAQNDSNGNTAVITGVNFIENDFVDTQQVVNWGGDLPNYVIVVNEDNSIASRWFVVNTIRTREGQLKLTLHRDVIVDNWTTVLNAPAFIEKGTPLDIEDSAIYNNENMSFNQIKRKEIWLKDKTNCPWIVAYLIPDSLSESKTISFDPEEYPYDAQTGVTFHESFMYQYSNFAPSSSRQYILEQTSQGTNKNLTLLFKTRLIGDNEDTYWNIIIDKDLNVVDTRKVTLGSGDTAVMTIPFMGTALSFGGDKNYYINAEVVNEIAHKLEPVKDSIFDQSKWTVSEQPTSVSNPTLYTEFIRAGQGSIYRFDTATEGHYEYFSFSIATNNRMTHYSPATKNSSVYNDVLTTLQNNPTVNAYNEFVEDNTIQFDTNGTDLVEFGGIYEYKFLDGNQFLKTSVTISPSLLKPTVDSSFAMLCMPYSDQRSEVFSSGSASQFTVLSKATGLAIMQRMVTELGQSVVSDIQLLPYCPLRNLIDASDKLNILGASKAYVKDEYNHTVQVLVCATVSRFEFSIDLPSPISAGETILDKKIINETQLYRLSSPLYDASFDFNPAKNSGVTKINVDFRYKPYAPYIHLAPDFDGLYGTDFDDARGLTVAGDFSIDQVSSAWTEYQIQNKNYQRMFDRQIQNIEVNNKIEREQQKWQIAAGVAQGAAQGYQMGSSTFMGLGGLFGLGAAGAAAGAAAAAAAGAADLRLSDQRRSENLNYVKDQFAMQMQNIQALPNTITKISAFDMNIRYYPFLEYYTCTDEEVKALKLKIQYSGMTIQRIGTFAQYLNPDSPYLQGYLIRNEGAGLDYHIVAAINSELKQGVFIK